MIYWEYPGFNNMPTHSIATIDFNTIQQTAAPSFKLGGSDWNIGALISAFLPYIFSIAGILLLFYLLAGGFQLLLSGGEPKKIQGAWGKITNALLGFLIIFIAYWVTQLVGQILNIPTFGDIFK